MNDFEKMEQMIKEVEGIKVDIKLPKEDLFKPYSYVNRFNDKYTLKEFLDKRLSKFLGGVEVTFLDSKNNYVPTCYRLFELRDELRRS